MKRYDHATIEKKWQKIWSDSKGHVTRDDVPSEDNFYLLTEFPYPSGNLHVGHWYAFSVPDILARALRMRGKNVLYPIGFDAFGLPAENAAIKHKLNPREWTYANMERMRAQIRSMGASFDWSREVVTCDPAYYRWTQWLFLQFFKKGLVERKQTPVNWCPNDKTVLANEQVVNGRCERCGAEVVQKDMMQWNIKITEYADRLIDDLEPLDWPKEIKESQKNWIGRSEGAEIDFFLDFGDEEVNARTGPDGKKAHITVFTTRPDTLFGATYLVLAPEHLWVTLALRHKTVLKNNDEVQTYVDQASRKTELERQTGRKKTGVQLKGVEALNPATGERIPLFVADYVLGHYGTGAIMAVPAHDERDRDFARAFDLPVKRVVEPLFIGRDGEGAVREGLDFVKREAVCAIVRNPADDTYLCISWKGVHMRGLVTGGTDGEDFVEAAKREIREETGYKNLRLVEDPKWSIHTQFYHRVKKENRWAHFHFVFFDLEDEARDPVDEKEASLHEVLWKKKEELKNFFTVFEGDFILNVLEDSEYAYTGEGILCDSGEYTGIESGEARRAIAGKFGRAKKTYRLRDWIVSRQRYWGVPIPIIHCETCGSQPVPDEQLPVLLPEIEDYLPTGEGKSPLAKATEWVETSCPNCGGRAVRETDTLDTFVDSSWYFLRYTDPNNSETFADAKKMGAWMPVDLYSGGAEHTTMHLLYSRFWQKAMFDLGLVKDAEPYARRKNRSIILGPDGQKMSKSRGNVIDPDEVVAQLGADTVRMYLAFIGPYNEVSSYPWNPDGVVGVRRFLERVWKFGSSQTADGMSDVESLEPTLHKSIQKISGDVDALKFNTAISQLMILLNTIEKEGAGSAQWGVFLRLLAPFAPHIAAELWESAGHTSPIHEQQWPEFDPARIKEEAVRIAIQIDGTLRGVTEIPADASREDMEAAAKETLGEKISGANIRKTIIVPGRLVNFVLER